MLMTLENGKKAILFTALVFHNELEYRNAHWHVNADDDLSIHGREIL